MFDKGLVGLDLSPISDKLVEWLAYLRKLGTRKLYLLHVIPESLIEHAAGGIPVDRIVEDETRRARVAFEKYTRLLEQQGFVVEVLDPVVGHPAAVIAEKTGKLADFAVVGGKGHSWLREILIGSTVEELLRLSRKPVLVAKGFRRDGGLVVPPDPFSSTVIAAVDVLEVTEGLAQCIVEVAARTRPPRLMLLYVDEHGIGSSEAEKRVQPLLQSLRARGVDPVFEVMGGQPYKSILRAIERYDARLVVMGSHGSGESRLRGLLLGTTTDIVVRHSRVSVLVCR